MRKPLHLPLGLALLLTACPEPGPDPSGSDGETSVPLADLPTETETTDGACPVGIDGCPCSDAASCYPGLECVDDVCVPQDPCPVGSAGCSCTNAGTCDPGSVCEDGLCTCTPGEFGCSCLDGGCFDGLDCTDGLCEIPELVSEAADGWGPVTCWGSESGQSREDSCTALRGDVAHVVLSACAVAEHLVNNEWIRVPEWPGFHWGDCADGVATPETADPWVDAGCFLVEMGGTRCYGRLGHLWIEIRPECSTPEHEVEPWGPIPDIWGCDPLAWPVPAPMAADVDEWRCGLLPWINDHRCMARYGQHWTWPYPPCTVDPVNGPMTLGQVPYDGWSPFECL